MNAREASDLAFEALHEEDVFEEAYVIDASVVESFLQAFGDRSPLHVDDDYARQRGFPSRVAHGALLNGFLSHFIGMRVPGRRALLLSVELRYAKPCFVGDALKLQARVVQRSESTRTIVLRVIFHNETRGTVVADGRVQVAVGP